MPRGPVRLTPKSHRWRGGSVPSVDRAAFSPPTLHLSELVHLCSVCCADFAPNGAGTECTSLVMLFCETPACLQLQMDFGRSAVIIELDSWSRSWGGRGVFRPTPVSAKGANHASSSPEVTSAAQERTARQMRRCPGHFTHIGAHWVLICGLAPATLPRGLASGRPGSPWLSRCLPHLPRSVVGQALPELPQPVVQVQRLRSLSSAL